MGFLKLYPRAEAIHGPNHSHSWEHHRSPHMEVYFWKTCSLEKQATGGWLPSKGKALRVGPD